MTTIAYEIDHVGPRDFRVLAVQDNGKREWCQTYSTRRAAEAGLKASERANPPKRTPRSQALREARQAVSRAVGALEEAADRLILADPFGDVSPRVEDLRERAEALRRDLSRLLGPADSASYIVGLERLES